ncbi:MAG: hypothetical protein ABSC42_10460 [Tepidisphaeraceae bacterium]
MGWQAANADYREGAQRWLRPQPKEFYREGAKDAKLREVKINSCFLLRVTSRPLRLRGNLRSKLHFADQG